MKISYLLIPALAANFAARADFSYVQSTKSTKGPAQVVKMSFKGSRTATETTGTVSILDFNAHTVTVLDKNAKTYSVKKFSEIMPTKAGNVDPKIEVKETGGVATINGLHCTETLLVMFMEAPPPSPPGTRMRVEVDLWISTGVPGWQNLRSFYEANSASVTAIADGSSGLPKILAEVQKRMITMTGVPVRQTTRVIPVARDPLAPAPAPSFESIIENSSFSAAEVSGLLFVVPPGFVKK